ncbi:hypothetical protein KUF71_015186 [Frankliniella fusca]|uniref:Uncharacterized protein n=1 Tax=Frankliniella fusca TaxID=407009 RepID=A0AAE1HU83_9NEOP|nr:hypothetical protein KUF71_015186 [Frankliniella fusca]
MSAYFGPSPVQTIGHKQQMWRKLENFQYDPALAEMAPLTYFNNSKTPRAVNMYDSLFNQPEGWDQRRPRCDRRLVSHIHPEIYEEEEAKVVPVLWSLSYGRPTLPEIDLPSKEFNRRPQMATFSRRLHLQMTLERQAADIPGK